MAKALRQGSPLSQLDIDRIGKIVDRSLLLFPDRVDGDIRMDLIVTHKVNPLRLQDLLEADDFNFIHDIGGIERHLNRHTFQLDNGFRPRFSERKAK